MLSWFDIKLRYRRTVIGPLWIPLTSLASVLVLGLVWSALFQQPLSQYLPYLACGLALWFFLSTVWSEAPLAFMIGKSLAHQVNLPLSVHIYRRVLTSALIFLHNALAFVLVAVALGTAPGHDLLLIFPALAMLFVLGLWTALILGVICLRYRDLAPALNIALGVIPLLTPIYYRADMLRARPWIYQYNPIYHFIEICRAPLLGMPTLETSWKVVVACNLLGSLLAIWVFARYRSRLTYWM